MPCSSRSQAKKSCIITQSPGPDRARVDRSTALFLTLCVVVFAVLSCWSVCLVNSVNERGLSLLKGFRYDSYLITSWRDSVCLTQGSLRQRQVCDALGCSGLHARYTDAFTDFVTLPEKVG